MHHLHSVYAPAQEFPHLWISWNNKNKVIRKMDEKAEQVKMCFFVWRNSFEHRVELKNFNSKFQNDID
jgi:hypothetical protein